ncbi:MAG: relaxase/mobilization nuclease domain-containing protein [Brevibacterium sp.]|uniref:MobA/VirD2-like nuclease domain-containing protein n=1 Tax=Brevibacterium aurantiacum TaxID=273384 RepID=A0A2A3YYD6_BREAU|nr:MULTISPECIES: relaxase/mobilization nuclease domain-containing protein [Brevibacterium]MDN5586693.1 relaxase/mobilization nuclease domain-containing protein [Brevibacterium sp.]PCC44268.1 hypothetical protein CIK65_01310 [Brevibacterium aurantiacum]HCG55819.1 hypothetical protein [Brevibacterium sp.]
MSTCNVRPSKSAADSVGYALYGRGDAERAEHLANGTNRAAEFSCSVGSAEDFVARAEALSKAHGRKVELYSYTQNFPPDEFDVNSPDDVRRVHELGVKLAKRLNSADYLVATHIDSAAGHAHNHVYQINHDRLTGKALKRNTSWKRGLRWTNDKLMKDEGCRVLPSPERPPLDWSQRREEFAVGGFERELGDRVADSLRDPRSVSREAFTDVLSEHGVTLAETKRDGLTYKMRRSDNGKIGRRKASGLTPEFTAEGTQQIFEFHSNSKEREKQDDGYLRGYEQREDRAAAGLDLARARLELAEAEAGRGAGRRAGGRTQRDRADAHAAASERERSFGRRRGRGTARSVSGGSANRGRDRGRSL